MFYRKCPKKRVGTERENSGEKKRKEKRKKMYEKKRMNEGILWLEESKEI